jgi:hypothetical protein
MARRKTKITEDDVYYILVYGALKMALSKDEIKADRILLEAHIADQKELLRRIKEES